MASNPASEHRPFDLEPLQNGLRLKSIHGGLTAMTAEGLSLLMRLASTSVLARVLLPEHFGLISMVTALTVVAERFKDLGLSDSTVQRTKITHGQVSNLFWINVLIGTLIMIAVAALSPVIGWFYADQRLAWIALALSANFFFSSLTIQHHALLRREMRFATLAQVQIIATVVSIAVAITLAFHGYE